MGSSRLNLETWWNPGLLSQPDRLTDVRSWHGHIPFAFWVVEAAEPRTVVELGTHKGDSFAALCQRVKEIGLDATCYAVDTWAGDEHSGLYGEEVFSEVSEYFRSHYGGIAKLLRMYFDDALAHFDDGSIDLLHIDGYHTYEAVFEDFAKWLRKMSASGIVMLHDIAVREHGFGVWRFWEEISPQYPNVAFTHSSGLGVMAVGELVPQAFNALVKDFISAPKLVSQVFESAGRFCELKSETEVKLREAEEVRSDYAQHAANLEAHRNLLLDRTYLMERQLREQEEEIAQMGADLRRAADQLVQQRGQAEHALARFAEVSAQRDEILASEAWRATAPARQAAHLVKRSVGWTRFLRPMAVELEPEQGCVAEVDGTQMRALGGLVRYAVTGMPLRIGLYRFDIGLEYPKPEGVEAHILCTKSQGTTQVVARSVFDADGTASISVHSALLDGEVELALVGMTGSFRVRRFVVTPAVVVGHPILGRVISRVVPGVEVVASEESAAEAASIGLDPYIEWIERNERVTSRDRELIGAEVKAWRYRPLISVIIPVYNTPREYLFNAIESVRAQAYPHWELCISDDGSGDFDIEGILAGYLSDPRVKVRRSFENRGISANTNAALDLAQGDYAAFLDADDELSELALYFVAREINAFPGAELIFSDEDKLDQSGRRSGPYFKPEFSPELMLGKNAVTHLAVYRTATVRELGGMRGELDGSQDWDLALRLFEAKGGSRELIRRIPRILYHWRILPGSTAMSTAEKDYAVDAGRDAVSSHLRRLGVHAEVSPVERSWSRNRIRVLLGDKPPRVSILIPTSGDYELLRTCVDSLIQQTDYPDFETLVIIDDWPKDDRTLAYLDTLSAVGKVGVLRYSRAPRQGFNYSTVVNRLAKEATGEILVMLNDDTEIVQGDWLFKFVSTLSLPGVGVVGAKLLYPSGEIQHAGVVAGLGGSAAHAYVGWGSDDPGYFDDLLVLRNASAVTGACMAVRRSTFDELGGMDEQHLAVAFNDTDFCFRTWKQGLRVVIDPSATVVHRESVSRGLDDTWLKRRRFEKEAAFMEERWGHIIADDPFYNPNLVLKVDEIYTMDPHPRYALRPWEPIGR